MHACDFCQEDLATRLTDALDEIETAGWAELEAAEALVRVFIAIHMGELGADPKE